MLNALTYLLYPQKKIDFSKSDKIEALVQEMLGASIALNEIYSAIIWLQNLQLRVSKALDKTNTVRTYTPLEAAQLTGPIRNWLVGLERNQLLTISLREQLLKNLLASNKSVLLQKLPLPHLLCLELIELVGLEEEDVAAFGLCGAYLS